MRGECGRDTDDGSACERGRPAAAGADTVERRDERVAVHDGDAFHRHRQLVGRELGERRLMTLSVRCLAGDDGDGTVGLELGRRSLRGSG